MSYLNVDFDFFDHPKTRRLRAILGNGSETTIMRIWAHCGKFHPDDGVLAGYSVPELEEICGWRGEPGKAIEALVTVRFLEQCSSNAIASCSSNATAFQVHDWLDHQGHISMLKGRAKAAAAARWGNAPKNNAQAMLKQCSSNAASNAPSVPLHSNPIERGELSPAHLDANIPTEKEFCDRFMTVGIPLEYLAEKWVWFSGNNEWLDKRGQIKNWFILVKGWWKKDRENWSPHSRNGPLTAKNPNEPPHGLSQKDRDQWYVNQAR